MEISEIKAKLSLADVLKHYGLKPDKSTKMLCPFHEDKTPSMQVYWKEGTAYCFSSNCRTHGRKMDQIDFVMYKENFDSLGMKEGKHKAINKCVEMINGVTQPTSPAEQLNRSAFLTKMFTYFKNAVYNCPPAKNYFAERCLDNGKLEIGYNGGQFHHGKRKDEGLIQTCIKFGLLQEHNIPRFGEITYRPFGKWCIVFALKNKYNQVTGMYFRSTLNDDTKKHYYLKDRVGLYPHYPNTHTKKLILTEAIIDAASLLMDDAITKDYEILACYGTNGLAQEHIRAIKELNELEEIIFFFDGDKSGRSAVNKYGEFLQKDLPKVKISVVKTPDNEDVNSLAQSHEVGILLHLVNQREEFFLSPEKFLSDEKKEFSQIIIEATKETPEEIKQEVTPTNGVKKDHHLNTSNPHNLLFTAIEARYTIKGLFKSQLDSLKISIQIIHKENSSDYRARIDLYEYKQIQSFAETASDILQLRKDQIEKDLQLLTHLLEEHREEVLQQQPEQGKKRVIIKVPDATVKQCIGFMQQKDLLRKFNDLIGKAGVVGEETNRILLFIIATSYKMKYTLHGIVQGSSGSGKTKLVQHITNLLPPEDVKRFTRVTESSFYNYGEFDLANMFLSFEDIDGLKEEALLALRELKSNDILISSTSQKFEDGNIRSVERIVRGPIASLSATTRGEIYEDNMSRSFLITINESKEQTLAIIQYQNDKAAGEIDEKKEQEIILFIQNCIRLLKPYQVINPFANKIKLPEDAHKIRRLNEMYQSIVKQITIINQYQRKKDSEGRLVTEKEDMYLACEILFESILLKVDELDGSLRQFYERLKKYVDEKGKDYEFNRFEVREATGVSKTQQHRYMMQLINLEYLKQYGFGNKGFKYKIAHWDNMAALRSRIKDNLETQLQKL